VVGVQEVAVGDPGVAAVALEPGVAASQEPVRLGRDHTAHLRRRRAAAEPVRPKVDPGVRVAAISRR